MQLSQPEDDQGGGQKLGTWIRYKQNVKTSLHNSQGYKQEFWKKATKVTTPEHASGKKDKVRMNATYK